MKKNDDLINKPNPIMETYEVDGTPNAREWLQGESLGSENEENLDVFGYTFEKLTPRANKSHDVVSNNFTQCAKRYDEVSSGHVTKSILGPVDEEDDELLHLIGSFLRPFWDWRVWWWHPLMIIYNNYLSLSFYAWLFWWLRCFYCSISIWYSLGSLLDYVWMIWYKYYR
jgi:hypothetical protein